jgi:hypothetical protein
VVRVCRVFSAASFTCKAQSHKILCQPEPSGTDEVELDMHGRTAGFLQASKDVSCRPDFDRTSTRIDSTTHTRLLAACNRPLRGVEQGTSMPAVCQHTCVRGSGSSATICSRTEGTAACASSAPASSLLRASVVISDSRCSCCVELGDLVSSATAADTPPADLQRQHKGTVVVSLLVLAQLVMTREDGALAKGK